MNPAHDRKPTGWIAVWQTRLGRAPMYLQICVAAFLGVTIGMLVHAGQLPVWANAPFFVIMDGSSGALMKVLKALAIPLIFLAVLNTFIELKAPWRKCLRMLAISACNALAAISIGLGIAALLRGGKSWVMPSNASAGAAIPGNPIEPFTGNSFLSVALIAIFLGISIRALKRSKRGRREVLVVVAIFRTLFRAIRRLLEWIVLLLPVAILGSLAGIIGKNGIAIFHGLGIFTCTILLGLILHALVYYSLVLRFVARMAPSHFFLGARDAIVAALSCGSTVATLPVTLRGLRSLRVSNESARLAACVGTNLNHDGIILYEAAAAVFVAQAAGLQLSLGQQITVSLLAAVVSLGSAGIPNSGWITLPLVLRAAGIPDASVMAIVPALLAVDWVLGRFRAATGVISDMVVAVLLDRWTIPNKGQTQGTRNPDCAENMLEETTQTI